MTNPSKEDIRRARKAAGLTQEAAAKLVYKSTITWKTWESGMYKMAPDTWELFNLKTKKGE